MIELICCVGLHWILKYGTILNILRDFVCRVKLINKLFKCSLCLGFWCGLLVAHITDNNIFTYSCASAGACWFVDNINNTLQSIEIKLDKK